MVLLFEQSRKSILEAELRIQKAIEALPLLEESSRTSSLQGESVGHQQTFSESERVDSDMFGRYRNALRQCLCELDSSLVLLDGLQKQLECIPS